MSTFVIAEAGLNFSGSIDKALKMVDAAKRAGANAIKFQAFLPSFDPAFARFTLSLEEWYKVFSCALQSQILFMCTPFDRWAFDMLRDMGVKHWKIPSGELTNDEYLKAIPEQATYYYLSTGMATEEEIDHALAVLPNPNDKNICVMYCVSGYPTPRNQMGLHTILNWTFCKYPQYTIGFSDHSEEYDPPMPLCPSLAVALGAEVIERHFMLEGPGDSWDDIPDAKVSLIGEIELRWYINRIRQTEEALESPIKKRVMPCEEPTLKARNRFRGNNE